MNIDRKRLFALVCLVFVAALVASYATFVRPIPVGSVSAQESPVIVTVNQSAPAAVTKFNNALTNAYESLYYPWKNNDQAAVANARNLIKQSTVFHNNHIMSWGADNPWPDPAQPEPSNWWTLDTKLQIAVDAQNTPIITLMNAPWWMKGIRQPDGSTRLLTQADDWSDLSYSSRILDNRMNDWLHLVRRVAERYMVAPYNVRYFQVWNEFKGYYHPIDGTAKGNDYDYENTAGDPSGPNAKHGYTYMYNRVYQLLKQVAAEKGIDPATVNVGGPYVIMESWRDAATMSHPSNLRGAWGVMDRRPMDAITYWLANKAGAEFITFDGGNLNRDDTPGSYLADGFVASDKYADVNNWVRQQPNGGATLPIWWAEWYVKPRNLADTDQTRNATWAYATIKQVKSDAAAALHWLEYDTDFWTPTDTAGGGQAKLWYFTYKSFKDFFPAGTQLYQTTVSDPLKIEVLASRTKAILVNRTNAQVATNFNGNLFSMAPYEVKILDVPAAPSASPTAVPTANPSPSSTPATTPTMTPASTPTPAVTTVTRTAIADTYVASNKPATNYGSAQSLLVDNSPVDIPYFKFDLSGLSGSKIVSAKFRFKVGRDASAGVQTVKNLPGSWTETGVTYNTRPILSTSISSFTGNKKNTWMEVDVTSAAVANAGQTMSLGIDQLSTDSLEIFSRESSNKPALIIVTQ